MHSNNHNTGILNIKSITDSKYLNDYFVEKIPLIESRRQAIDQKLNSNEFVAYGFSSFLGHLDHHHNSNISTQRHFVESHLVGSPQSVSPSLMRSIAIVKLCHLSHGESGISPGTYTNLIEYINNPQPGKIDFIASYGSGDVVPGCWWINSLGDEFIDALQPGDAIALMNGSFVPVGLLIDNYEALYDAVVESGGLIDKTAGIIGSSENVQLPVSLRDLGVLDAHIHSAKKTMCKIIEKEIHSSRFNPLFDNKDHSYGRSQSSFLNFSTLSLLHSLSCDLAVISTYLRSATLHLCAYWEDKHKNQPANQMIYPQKAKVSKAYTDRIAQLCGMNTLFSQTESEGIEDIGDGLLHKMIDVVTVGELIKTQSDILASII